MPPRNLPVRAAVALLVAACSSESTAPAQRSQARTSLPRQLTVAEQDVIAANSTFAFGLLREVNRVNREKNVFISPLSASMALGMTMNGAAGQTRDEMRAALGFGTLPMEAVNASYRSLIDLLRGLDASTELQIANSIWHRNTFPFHATFLDTARTYFDARVRGLDFDDPASVDVINAWVSESTKGKIPTIVDAIGGDVVMYLMNAIYFKGAWRTRFDPAHTRDEPFAALDGTRPAAKMMAQRGSFDYYENAELRAVDLPYGDSAFTMVVVLPKAGTDVNALAESLTPERWATVVAGLRASDVDVHLPKFKLTFEQVMNEQLQALGMRAAFDGADFTPMSPAGDALQISEVRQKTFVDVNEEGTEAAAVTSVEVKVVSAPPEPIVFRADRPFLLAIRERLSGTLLFVGKVVAPPPA